MKVTRPLSRFFPLATATDNMTRLIKRYGSRKLYDTEESRYVSLDEIADWIRGGQNVQVQDNVTADDVTAQTLGQIITEEGRRGQTLFRSELLHDMIRSGERVLSSGVEQLQHGVGKLFEKSIQRIGPVRRAREETARMRERLDELEASLARIDDGGAKPKPKKAARRVPSAEKPASEESPRGRKKA